MRNASIISDYSTLSGLAGPHNNVFSFAMKPGIYKGIILLIVAELCFAGATVFVKFATTGTDIPGIEASFFRFLLGFFIAGYAMIKSKLSFKPNKTKLVIWRAVLNTVALIFFFLSVKHTTLTNANMLNMTYPAFIFLFAPMITKEKMNVLQSFYLILTISGIYLVIHPNFTNINIGDWYALISGITAALAVLTLRMAREFDSTTLILFYLMSIGLVINGALLLPIFVMPNLIQFENLLFSAVLGFAGQAFITSGYKHIDASKGSIVSSSRIIFSVIFGATIFYESFNVRWLIGGTLILISLIGISWPKPGKQTY
jgi:drug/metabolite transporter (DMT)-like permease